MVAVLEGSQVDDGTAWELGCHYEQFGAKAAIGIRTDFRRAGESHESKVNLMVELSCRTVAMTPDDLISELKETLEEFSK